MTELSAEYPVQLLCKVMSINRSSFYAWRKTLLKPARNKLRLAENVLLFKQYHAKYPSHGYRWLNAKIELDKGIKLSAPYAYKCCRIAGVKSTSRHYRYKKPGEKGKLYPNLLAAGLNVDGPMKCIVSDMTAFYLKGLYYELTLYMDIWNNEIRSYSLSGKRGDRMTYISGLNDLISIKKAFPGHEMVLHSDQGSVYASKAFNELLPQYGIIRSMSRAGTPTDNAAMEAINGWIKAELFEDFHVDDPEKIVEQIAAYIKFFNEERPAYSLNYMTPKQFREFNVF